MKHSDARYPDEIAADVARAKEAAAKEKADERLSRRDTDGRECPPLRQRQSARKRNTRLEHRPDTMKCKHCESDIDNRGECPWGCNQDPESYACPHCGHIGSTNPYGMNHEIHECMKCKGTWFDQYKPGNPPEPPTLLTECITPYPEGFKAAVDKLREALYDNPCCLGDEGGSVHFLSDAELYLAIKAVIPSLPNAATHTPGATDPPLK